MNGRCTRYARLLSVVVGLCLATATADAGTRVSLTADAELIDPSATVDVEMFVTHTGALDDLAGYQGVLDISGGDDGSLDVDDVNVNHSDSDWVFSSLIPDNYIDCTGGGPWLEKLCVVTFPGFGVEVVNPGYMGDFTLLASSDAEGVFEVDIDTTPESGTELFDDDILQYSYTTGAPEDVGVDVECFADRHCGGSTPYCKFGATAALNECVECLASRHCDDSNDCTTDSCNTGSGNVCQHGNKSQGTSCDDGLFCTDVDECDGAGTCEGTGDPCTTSPYTECCENDEVCLDPNGFINCSAG